MIIHQRADPDHVDVSQHRECAYTPVTVHTHAHTWVGGHLVRIFSLLSLLRSHGLELVHHDFNSIVAGRIGLFGRRHLSGSQQNERTPSFAQIPICVTECSGDLRELA